MTDASEDIDLDELRRLAEAATPGKRSVEGSLISSREASIGQAFGVNWRNDQAFIAAADPQTVLALVARVRDAEARADRFDAVGAYAALREELSIVRRAHTVTLQRLRKAEARIEKAEDYVTRHYLDTTVGERILAVLTEGGEQ